MARAWISVDGSLPDVVLGLRALDDRYLVARSTRNLVLMQMLVAGDFLLLDSDGQWMDREQHLAARMDAPISRCDSCEDAYVRIVGDTALIHGAASASRGEARGSVFRYTNVYYRHRRQWQLVAAQETRIASGVLRPQQRGVPFTPDAWTGSDPVGEDFDVLRQLNDEYVDAFRRADVAWYDAHLAPEFVVVNSDGSFEDRASALQSFGRPDFAMRLNSFEIANVRLRRFGDVVLVHADATYESKQGVRGANRYTDIWRKASGGRWLCMSAHITGCGA